MINPKIRAKDRIYKNLPVDLQELMRKYVLSEKIHNQVLENIKEQSYFQKTPSKKPKFIIVAGQTGSGKSNLTSYLMSIDNNLVSIDSDRYKAYRPDNDEIMRNHFEKYAYLTAPDCYLHRDEMVVDSLKSKYNIIMDCAPSKKDGLFVDIDWIKSFGYEVEIHTLAVSAINSTLSVHERYEALLELNCKSAKLTSIERHNDSYDGLIDSIMKEQNNKDISIYVYKRGKERPYTPVLVYDSLNSQNFSCPLEAIVYTQINDIKQTLPTAIDRYNLIYEQMKNRKAPQSQFEQLKLVKEDIEILKENYNERG